MLPLLSVMHRELVSNEVVAAFFLQHRLPCFLSDVRIAMMGTTCAAKRNCLFGLFLVTAAHFYLIF